MVSISDAILLPVSPLTSPALPAPPTNDSDHAKCEGVLNTTPSIVFLSKRARYSILPFRRRATATKHRSRIAPAPCTRSPPNFHTLQPSMSPTRGCQKFVPHPHHFWGRGVQRKIFNPNFLENGWGQRRNFRGLRCPSRVPIRPPRSSRDSDFQFGGQTPKTEKSLEFTLRFFRPYDFRLALHAARGTGVVENM